MTQPLARIRLRDFLMPARLLAETDAADNPFVRHGERRGRRIPRMAMRIGLGLLLAGFVALCLVPHWFGVDLTPSGPWAVAWERDNPPWDDGPLGLRWDVCGLLLWAFAFLTLRYHLFVNDQSHHLKSIAREQLEHLMLSRLGPNEYFLHHFLLFCLRYEVFVGFAIVFGVATGGGMLAGEWRWVEAEFWAVSVALLAVFLFAWSAGTLQYVVEWRLFAASRVPWLRLPTSMALSAILAVPIAVAAFAIKESPPIVTVPLVAGVFAACTAVVHAMGRSLYGRSEAILWNRFVGRGSAEARADASTASAAFGAWRAMLLAAAFPLWPLPRWRPKLSDLGVCLAWTGIGTVVLAAPRLLDNPAAFAPTVRILGSLVPIPSVDVLSDTMRIALLLTGLLTLRLAFAAESREDRIAALRAGTTYMGFVAAGMAAMAAVGVVGVFAGRGASPAAAAAVTALFLFLERHLAVCVEWFAWMAVAAWGYGLAARLSPRARAMARPALAIAALFGVLAANREIGASVRHIAWELAGGGRRAINLETLAGAMAGFSFLLILGFAWIAALGLADGARPAGCGAGGREPEADENAPADRSTGGACRGAAVAEVQKSP